MAIDPPTTHPCNRKDCDGSGPCCHDASQSARANPPSQVPNFPPMLSTVWVRGDGGMKVPVQVHGMEVGPTVGPYWWTNAPNGGYARYTLDDEGEEWQRDPPKLTVHVEQDFKGDDPDRIFHVSATLASDRAYAEQERARRENEDTKLDDATIWTLQSLCEGLRGNLREWQALGEGLEPPRLGEHPSRPVARALADLKRRNEPVEPPVDSAEYWKSEFQQQYDNACRAEKEKQQAEATIDHIQDLLRQAFTAAEAALANRKRQ